MAWAMTITCGSSGPISWGFSVRLMSLNFIENEIIRKQLGNMAEVLGVLEGISLDELILQVLRQCQGVQTRTATRLGINRNTLHKKIEEYSLQDESR